MISYEKLVLKLKENGFSQYKLKQEKITGISNHYKNI